MSPVTLFAVELVGNASVNVTSDTAATAKNMAMVEARRQIISESLAPFAIGSELSAAIKDSPDDVLANLVATTNIVGEKTSATTYSADIKMTIDSEIAAQWMTENNVENWIRESDPANSERTSVVIQLRNGLRDIIELGKILRTRKIGWKVKRISDGMVTISVPAANRAGLIAAARTAGVIVIQ